MAASDWAPALGAGIAATIAFGSAAWVQARAWRAQQRTRWDDRTLETYAESLKNAASAFHAAILIARDQPDPSPRCFKQFDKHYGAIEANYEALVLLSPASQSHARMMLWTSWNVGKQQLPEGRDQLLATSTRYQISHPYSSSGAVPLARRAGRRYSR
jgi:hypothetical protein